MTAITASPAPGAFLSAPEVTLSFDATVASVAYSTDGTPPSISKYIAYDTLTPANPFIAVTEDGRGRVVYDGGFPKFYNGVAPASTDTFATLTGSFKYLYNALYWVANAEKVAVGNRKVLILGDAIASEAYPVKSTAASGFYTSFSRLCAIAGFTPTFKDRSDYGGSRLNPTLTELEAYACVIVMSSDYVRTDCITPQAINDFVTYRENGNGLIVITDHGGDFTSVTTAGAGGYQAFFTLANQIVAKFGAYFTGNFDRTSVNVGYLRTHYGDHPLYKNLTDAESIVAGGSESKVVVSTTTTYAPAAVPKITLTGTGNKVVQVLAIINDGSMVTGRFLYIVQGAEFLFSTVKHPTTGVNETNQGKLYSDYGGRASVTMSLDGSTLGTVWGELLLNGKRVGELYYTSAGGSQVYWYAGAPESTPVRNGDVLVQAISVPFGYQKTLTVERKTPLDPRKGVSLPVLLKEARAGISLKNYSAWLKQLFNTVKASLPTAQQTLPADTAKLARVLSKAFHNELQYGTLNAKIYPTTALTTAAIAAATPVVPGVCFIDASTNTVYGYQNGSYRLLSGLKAQDIFGSPRIVVNPVTQLQFRLNTDGSVSQLS